VTAIVILVRHDENRAVPQIGRVGVLLTRRQSNDLLELGNLLGLLHLGICRVLDIENLALERIDSIRLALLLAQARQSHRLG